jgi:dihydroorotate dehydrogenase
MKLHGIDFGNVFGASGVQGFFGEGYWFHKLWKPFGLDFSGMTFVAKTATLLPRKGNMPFTNCVRVNLWRGAMLNAIGLSNPGLGALFSAGKWQKIKTPFWLSIMPTADTPQQRLEELKTMVWIIGCWKNSFSVPFGLQINLSCPNVVNNLGELIGESAKALQIASELRVPLMPKYSIASAPIKAIMQLNDDPHCDAICVSNTLPFGWPGINWDKSWGSRISPLAKLGGGGLSGKDLRPLVCEWISRLRDEGFAKPINGGGGILCDKDVKYYRDAGASSIFIGSTAFLRPWRVRGIINYANTLEWR